MTRDDSSPGMSEVEEAIRREMLEVHEQSYGTGASRVRIIVDPDHVVAVLDVELTPAEQTLLSAGETDAVKITRESFQTAIAPTFEAIVERATGRQVTSFLSAMSVEPPYSLEFFRLAPAD
jgi:uncharacterized protein YbcI